MFKRTLPPNHGLSYLVWKGDIAAVREAIALGADVNYCPPRPIYPSVRPPSEEEAPVLHRAAASADVAIMSVLLDAKGNIHATDSVSCVYQPS
ncbi:hypothetical protein PINS_up004378 [Pythium insidiosum]|nr:hypothetical protein PINS_up004378 [Pythium insidiosum]